MATPKAAELETVNFASPDKFRRWLEKNHRTSEGIWLRIYKKDSGLPSINHAQALEEALCYGWIDGQAKGGDGTSYVQKFTPRRARSNWSKLNTQHAERLIAKGRMMAAGLEAIEAAKADGRWAVAYDSPRNAAPPADFLEALKKNPKAKRFFEALNRTNVYSIVYRLQTAKRPETRVRRMDQIIGMLERGEKFHP
jgi:uncharacterized protein YdeI (YjbR/CyaY-like superfamily)